MKCKSYQNPQIQLEVKSLNKIKERQQKYKNQSQNHQVCRICLSAQNKSQFIKPCICSGSLQFVHNSCLIEWLNHVIIKKAELGQQSTNIHCQICQKSLQIEYGKKLQCKSLSTIWETIKLNKFIATICTIFIFMSIWVMGVLIFFKMDENQIQGINIGKTTFIAVLTFIILHTLIWIGVFSYCFFVRWKFYVITVKPKLVFQKSGMEIINDNKTLVIENQNIKDKNKNIDNKTKQSIGTSSTNFNITNI